MVDGYCILCKSKEKDDVRYGDFLTKNDVSVHTYCLYLTSNLVQNGDDDEGFFGFLIRDILKEAKRISKLQCCYCRKYSAGIGCCNASCSRSFHLICGIENGANNQFTKSFLSFCHKHRPSKVAPKPPLSNELCCICYNALLTPKDNLRQHNINIILSPCCKNGWFHKVCLQKFALTAGYFFKCPLCNDMKIFREELPHYGIFIPDRDAAWELEPNAFHDLLERPTTCSAKICYNKQGRSHNTKEDPLLFCDTCGSQAIHTKCWLDENDNKNKKQQQPEQERYNCNECLGTLKKLNLSNLTTNSNEQTVMEDCDNENNQALIDVCHISENSSDNEIKLSKAVSKKSFTEDYEKALIISSKDSKGNMDLSTSTDSSDDKPLCYKQCSKIKKSIAYILKSGDEQNVNNYNGQNNNNRSNDMDDRKSIIQVHIRNDKAMNGIQNDDNPLCILYNNLDRKIMQNTKTNNEIEFNLEKPSTSQNGRTKDIFHDAFINGHNSDSDFGSDFDNKPLSILIEEQKSKLNIKRESCTNQHYTTQSTRKRRLLSATRNSEIPSPFRSYYSKRAKNNSDHELQCTRHKRRRRRRKLVYRESRRNCTSQSSSDEEVFCINKNIQHERKKSQAFPLNNPTIVTLRSNRTCGTRNGRSSSMSTSNVSCRSLRKRRRLYYNETSEEEEEVYKRKVYNRKRSCINIKTSPHQCSVMSMKIREDKHGNDIVPCSRSCTGLRPRRRGCRFLCMNGEDEENVISPRNRSRVALRTRRRTSQLFNTEDIYRPKADYASTKEQSSNEYYLSSYDIAGDQGMKINKRKRSRCDSSRDSNSQVPKRYNSVRRCCHIDACVATPRKRRQSFSNKSDDNSDNSSRTSSLISPTFRSEALVNSIRPTKYIQRKSSLLSPTCSLSSIPQISSTPINLLRRQSNFS